MRYELRFITHFIMKLSDINFTLIQKRAFLKIAMELVKIDNHFHCNEVGVLTYLEKECNIQVDDIEMIHYISLSQAVDVLKLLDADIIYRIIEAFEKIVCVDNDIDIRENILLTALKMSILPQYSNWVNIISINDANSDCSQNQLAFVEKEYDTQCHVFFDNEFELLSLEKKLEKIGINLFYLPAEIKKIESFWTRVEENNKNSLALKHSLQFITPLDKRLNAKDAFLNLKEINQTSFYHTLLLHYKIVPDQIKPNAFLILKVKSGDLLNDFGNLYCNSDFMIISLDQDPKRRINDFLSLLIKPDLFISVDGYYKVLYEYLSEKSQMLGIIEVDNNFQLYFKNINSEKIVMKSYPQSCTFYLLLLKYGKLGITSQLFNDALTFLEKIDCDKYCSNGTFDLNALLNDLRLHVSNVSTLVYNLIIIYSTLSTKDIYSNSFLEYIKQIIKHRASLKNYVNSALTSLEEGECCDDFKILYDSTYKNYYIKAELSLFKKRGKENYTPLTESELWKKLK